MQLAVPAPKTPSGRVYRLSPNEAAHPRHFVLGQADEAFVVTKEARARMKLEPRSARTVCPYSGIVADDREFIHPDDVDAAKQLVAHAAVADVRAALSDMFKDLNGAQTPNAPIRVQASVKSMPKPKPQFSRRDLLRELMCDHCGRDYGVYAIGLFCPDCGAPNLRLHFAREVDLVRMQIELAEAQGDNHEELAYRLLGNAHEDVLTAFEATLKAVYLHGVARLGPTASPVRPPRNEFQNIDLAGTRFAELGLDPFDGLDAEELAILKLNIQKRHIIGHNLSVIDAKFAEHAEEARLGETVQLVGDDIRTFASISQRVVDRLDAWLGGSPAPMPIPKQSGDKVEQRGQQSPADDSVEARLACLDVELTPLARRLGCLISERSEQGMAWPLSEDAILAGFVGISPAELAEAIAELELEGFVTTSLRGSQLPSVRPTLDLYVTFDPIARGDNPVADAVILAKTVLAGSDAVGVAELHAETAWPLRRFNPAIGLVIAEVDEQRVSKTMDGSYPTRHFHMLPADRVALKRFVARLEA